MVEYFATLYRLIAHSQPYFRFSTSILVNAITTHADKNILQCDLVFKLVILQCVNDSRFFIGDIERTVIYSYEYSCNILTYRCNVHCTTYSVHYT